MVFPISPGAPATDPGGSYPGLWLDQSGQCLRQTQGKTQCDRPKPQRYDALCHPGGNPKGQHGASRVLSTHQPPGSLDEEHTQHERYGVDQQPEPELPARWQEVAQNVDTEVTMLARGQRGPEEAEPQDEMLQQLVSPEEATRQHITLDDLQQAKPQQGGQEEHHQRPFEAREPVVEPVQ